MNRFFKKAICVFLAVVMLFAVTVPAFAEGVDKTPVIVIPGVLNTPIFRSDTGEQVMMPDFANMSDEEYETLIGTLKYILKLQDNKDYEGATKKLIDLLYDGIGGCAYNADGTTKYPQHVIKNYENYNTNSRVNESIGACVADLIGKENVYVFTYNWCGEIITIVDNELAPFVEKVKKDTGSDKVKIVCVSMGGAVTSTYLNRYGDRNDVKKVVFVSSAGTGVEFVNSLLEKDITVVREAIGPYFKALADFPVPVAASAVSSYLKDIVGTLVDEQLDTLWDEFLAPFCLKMPAVWELAEHTDKIDKLLEEYGVSQELKEKVRAYYRIQDSYNDTLDKLQEKGVEICFTSNYNLVGVPFTSKAMVSNSDFLITTRQTSNGATAADLGTTLGDNYQQKENTDKDYLSKDNIIDASTCYSPDKTWFMKNLVHAIFGKDDCYTKFVAWLIVNNDTTIETSEDYPQFMLYTRKDNTLTPIEEVIIETDEATGDYVSSAVTVYRYTQITALGWALIAAIAVAIIILISKKKNKEPIEGVLSKAEIKALPKGERKAAKKQNKALTKEWKSKQKAAKKARKAELKAMPKAERKAAIKAEKAEKKAAAKQAKAQAKADKAQKKADKKAAKAEKKAAPTEETTQE